jgi:hypothetical protein
MQYNEMNENIQKSFQVVNKYFFTASIELFLTFERVKTTGWTRVLLMNKKTSCKKKVQVMCPPLCTSGGFFYAEGSCQAMGGWPSATSSALVRLKCLHPKKPM